MDFTTGKPPGTASFLTGADLDINDNNSEAVDHNGHGTFVTGLIGSQNPQCPGIAPETEIYILKLFNEEEMTYSAWFLDAFNFIKAKVLHVECVFFAVDAQR